MFPTDKFSATIYWCPPLSPYSLHQKSQLEFSLHHMQELSQASSEHCSPHMAALCRCLWCHANLAPARTAEQGIPFEAPETPLGRDRQPNPQRSLHPHEHIPAPQPHPPPCSPLPVAARGRQQVPKGVLQMTPTVPASQRTYPLWWLSSMSLASPSASCVACTGLPQQITLRVCRELLLHPRHRHAGLLPECTQCTAL